MISVISPIYNEADNIVELCERIVAALECVDEDFEFILVENGSKDRSLEIIKSLREKDHRIKYLSLSRNFGHQGGLLAGIAHASGDAVISIDGDLQQPPELIPKMIDLWKNGYDVVFTTKKVKNSNDGWRSFFSRIFYKFLSSISELNLTYGQSDFRLLDRKVVDVLLQIPEKNKFLRGMVEWVGFSQIGVEYEVSYRKKGRSKFSFMNYIAFAFDGIFSFSIVPLKIFLWSGIVSAFLCGLVAIYFLAQGLINIFILDRSLLPPGWATISLSITFLGSVQLIGIGLLGEYISRIYIQAKERPDFIVKEKSIE